MDKKQKKSLRRHLLVIYIFYFLALAAGFIHSFVPHVSSSLATGWQAASEDIRMQEKHGIAQHTYFLAARLQNAQSDETLFPIETGHASISTEAEYTGVNIYVKTDENSDPTVVRTLNRINYILLLSIPALLAKLSILILVALIINILRKSVRDEQPPAGAYHHLHACRRVPADSGRSLHRSRLLYLPEYDPDVSRRFAPASRRLVPAQLLEHRHGDSGTLLGRGLLDRIPVERRAKTHDLKKK